MFCPSCGTESVPDQRFCKNCGAALRAAGDTQNAPAVAAAPAPQFVPPPAQAPVQYVPPPPAGPVQYVAPPMPMGYTPPPGYAAYPLMVQTAPKSTALRNVAIILVVLIALGSYAVYYFRNGRTVTIGSKDQVVYSGSATQDQAIALGNALKTDGYFQDRGVTVLLKMGAGGTVMSFVVQDGYWNQPGTLPEFEEVVREVASPVGLLPVKLQLMDTKLDVEKNIDRGRGAVHWRRRGLLRGQRDTGGSAGAGPAVAIAWILHRQGSQRFSGPARRRHDSRLCGFRWRVGR